MHPQLFFLETRSMFKFSDIRKFAESTAGKVLFYSLAASFFIGFGVISFQGEGGFTDGAIVARVNGEPISNRDVNLVHQRIYDSYKEQLGDQLTEDILKQLNLRFQALSALVNRQVLLQEAKRMGLSVGEDELREYIMKMPAFQNAVGEFDKNRYKQLLATQRPPITPGKFEQQTREQLLVDKLENIVKSSVHLREDEVLREFMLDTREIDLYFLAFDAADFASRINIENQAIQDYYNANLEEFSTGEQAQIRLIQPKIELNSITIEDAAIRAAYEANKNRFVSEEQVRASHILIKLDDNANDAETQKALSKANTLLKRAQDGESFAALAKANSDDKGSAREGGSLGWFKRGQMVPEFEQAAFTAKRGEIVGPIKTFFGYHIIKVEDYMPAGQVPLSEAYESLRRELAQVEALRQAKAAAEALIVAVVNGRSIDQMLAENKAAWDERHLKLTSSQGSGDSAPAEVHSLVFASEPPAEGQPRLVETANGPYVVVVISRAPAEPRALAEVREQIKNKLINDRALTLAAEASAEALERLRNGEKIETVAKRYKVALQSTGAFTARNEEIPEIGRQNEIRNAALALTHDNRLARTTYRQDNKYYVIALKSLREPSVEDFSYERDARMLELLNKRRDEVWQQFLRETRSRFDIKLENSGANLMGG